jgi:Tol biopolymer transport system component
VTGREQNCLHRDHRQQATIWIMGADGSNPTQLTPSGANDSTPSATVDGKFIVFESTRGGGSDIWRMDGSGANPTQLTNCGKNFQPNVSPDGKWVVYRSECDVKNALWRIPLAGGQPVRITENSAWWPWVSPDGKWVACQYSPAAGESRLAIVPIEGGAQIKLLKFRPSLISAMGFVGVATAGITYRIGGRAYGGSQSTVVRRNSCRACRTRRSIVCLVTRWKAISVYAWRGTPIRGLDE